MKEQLTLEHLAPYLPYEVKLLLSTDIDLYSKWFESGKVYTADLTLIDWLLGRENPPFKLALRPMSDFCGEMTGGQVREILGCSFDVVREIWDLNSGDKTLDQISVGAYKVMCKNHIDFNDIIKSGLAIDINTIES